MVMPAASAAELDGIHFRPAINKMKRVPMELSVPWGNMPGLPKVPATENIDVDENGIISGLF